MLKSKFRPCTSIRPKIPEPVTYIYIYIYALFSVLRVLIFRSVKDSVEKNAKYELRFRLDLFDGVQNTDGPSIWC